MNRIVELSTRCAEKIATLPREKRERLDSDLDICLPEMMVYQREKSLAQLEGFISLEEAMTIYNALNRWDRAPLQTKVAVTLSMGRILERKRG